MLALYLSLKKTSLCVVDRRKVRTTNKKGRHLSTARILQLLIDHGVETPEGLQKLPAGRLTASTLNRHLRRLDYDHQRMTRVQVSGRALECALALRHEPLGPEAAEEPILARPGAPMLMLFSVVDASVSANLR
jgi:hypothetical protein